MSVKPHLKYRSYKYRKTNTKLWYTWTTHEQLYVLSRVQLNRMFRFWLWFTGYFCARVPLKSKVLCCLQGSITFYTELPHLRLREFQCQSSRIKCMPGPSTWILTKASTVPNLLISQGAHVRSPGQGAILIPFVFSVWLDSGTRMSHYHPQRRLC